MEQKAIPAPGLLILTGASHTGKTTIANSVLGILPPPAALLAVDDILEHQLQRPLGEKWSNIPLAYKILSAELKILLKRGWFVIVESTFTYVPPVGPPEFHLGTLQNFVDEANSTSAPAFVVQIKAPHDVVLSRAERTHRIPSSVVEATLALHNAKALPGPTHVIDSSGLDPNEAASSILARIEAESVGQRVDQSRKRYTEDRD